MKSQEKLSERDFFDSVAGIFDGGLNAYSKLAGRLRLRRRINLFLKALKAGYCPSVLEIGCGTGEYTRGLKSEKIRLFCADISYNMIKKAREKNPGAPNVYFVVSDAYRLPFKDGAFDAVVGNSILHHIVRVAEAVSQIRRVLKDGGRFAFSEPNMLNPQIFLQKNIAFIKKLSGDSPSEGAFLRWQIAKVFRGAGFRDVKVTPFDFLHPCCPGIFAGLLNRIGMRLFEKTALLKEIAGSLFIRGEK